MSRLLEAEQVHGSNMPMPIPIGLKKFLNRFSMDQTIWFPTGGMVSSGGTPLDARMWVPLRLRLKLRPDASAHWQKQFYTCPTMCYRPLVIGSILLARNVPDTEDNNRSRGIGKRLTTLFLYYKSGLRKTCFRTCLYRGIYLSFFLPNPLSNSPWRSMRKRLFWFRNHEPSHHLESQRAHKSWG